MYSIQYIYMCVVWCVCVCVCVCVCGVCVCVCVCVCVFFTDLQINCDCYINKFWTIL